MELIMVFQNFLLINLEAEAFYTFMTLKKTKHIVTF